MDRLRPELAPTLRYVIATWTGFTVLLAALVVLLPLRLSQLGYGVDATSAVIGAAGVGGVLSADLIGRAASRSGPVRLIRAGLATIVLSVIGLGLSPHLVVLLALNTLVGVGTSALRVGSQLLVRTNVAASHRGRIHGSQGATNRLTMLLAPVVVGLLWERMGPAAGFALPAAAGTLMLAVAGRPETVVGVGAAEGRSIGVPLGEMVRYSAGPILFQAARAGRLLVLPLVGLALDLSPVRIGLLVGLSAAADVLVSPVSGFLMDSRGRLWTITPSFTLMAGGFVLLALAQQGWVVGAAAVVLGVGNGFSSGLLLTLGTDLAPAGNEGPFLGRFGALSDIGKLVGPFLVGLLGETLGLSAAAFSLAVVTLIGLGLLVGLVGETKPRPIVG
ncbi:MAG: MFS transporter [Acidimicrobiia bacterium]|nr:MFS transporter [Acidimicrobiia bacterium]